MDNKGVEFKTAGWVRMRLVILAILAEYVCGVSDLKVGWKYLLKKVSSSNSCYVEAKKELIPTVNSNSCNLVVGLAGDDNMIVYANGTQT